MKARIPSPGSLFADRYRVEAVLGTGGMGVVLAVIDEKTGVDCALKLLSAPELSGDRARLVREARALMLISSPHVVRVFDVDEVEGVGPYLVLERLEGKDLGAVAPLGEPMPPEDVVRYGIQVCDALAAAHAAGIIHRDIKTSNLFLANTKSGPIIKVLDFGISKVGPGDGLGSLTNPTGPLGSPQFISPEQIDSPRGVDVRTDIWSTGVVLYRLLSGQFPFTGSSVGETFALVLAGRRPALSALAPNTPPALLAIVERCLERDRDKRFPTAAALGDALRAVSFDVAASEDELTDPAVPPPSMDVPTRIAPPPRPPAPPSPLVVAIPASTVDGEAKTIPVLGLPPALPPTLESLEAQIDESLAAASLPAPEEVEPPRRASRRAAVAVVLVGVMIPVAVAGVARIRRGGEPAEPPVAIAAPTATTSASAAPSGAPSVSDSASVKTEATIDLPPEPPSSPPRAASSPATTSRGSKPRPPVVHRAPEPKRAPEPPPPAAKPEPPPPKPEAEPPPSGLRGNPYKKE